MFSEDSASADEDEGLATSTNEWTYPDVVIAGRKVKTFLRQMFNDESERVLIALHVNQHDDPCGHYDEGLVPRSNATHLVSGWEILLRRTTIYMCAWADGIPLPKVLRKYILKTNPEWVKLYRYIWLKSQANHLVYFWSPKTFSLATCTDFEANEQLRNKLMSEASLPPAKAMDSTSLQIVRTERTIIISDLLLYWKSTSSKVQNDISSVAAPWGWNSIQQYAPEDYTPKADYLVQPCKFVAEMITQAPAEDSLRDATIHIWLSMADIVDYAGTKGNSIRFLAKESSTAMSSYFMDCFQMLADAATSATQLSSTLMLAVNS